MQNLPMWGRRLIIIGIIIILLLPLIILGMQRFALPARLSVFMREPVSQKNSDRFNVASEMPGYTIKLVDTTYLDYISEKMRIFGDQSIVDPRVYRGFPDLTLRHTVSRVRFVLAPVLDQFVIAIGGKDDFAGRGDYQVENNTLVVKVSLNPQETSQGIGAGQFSLKDTFLRTAAQTLYYAHGLSNGGSNMQEFAKIRKDIKEYVYSGIFAWPIRIEKQ